MSSSCILGVWWARGLHGCHPRKKERTCQRKGQEGNDGQVLGSQTAVATTGVITVHSLLLLLECIDVVILDHVNVIDTPESAFFFVYIDVYIYMSALPYESCKNIEGPAPPRCLFGAGTTPVQIISTRHISAWPN